MRIRVSDIPLDGSGVNLADRSTRPQAFSQGYRLGSTEDAWDRNWTPRPSLPDTELARHMTYMWGRSYDLHRNNGYVSGPTTRLAALVGELVPQFLTSDVEERDALSALWQEWSQQAGSDGVTSWAMLCEMLVGNACQGGDVLCLFDDRPELGGPIPLRINLVDAWRVAYPSDKDKDGKSVVMGVKRDRGMEIGYFVSRDGGGDPYYFARELDGRPGAVLFRRPDPTRRPGQTRSTPIATPYLNNIKDAWDHERHHSRTAGDRARMKAILQASDVQEIKKIFQEARQAEAAGNTEEARLIRQTAKATVVETPDAATMILPKWADYKATPTETVDPNFTGYMKGQLQAVAPGWGLGHEVAFLRMEEANFARAKIHFMQAGSEVKRWVRDIGAQLGRNLITLLVQYAWAYGYLKKKPTATATRVDWHGLPIEYMDIGSEVSAYADAKATGIMSPQAIARRGNTSWELTLREDMEYVAAHKALKEKLGLSDEDIASALGARKAAPTTATTKEPAP